MIVTTGFASLTAVPPVAVAVHRHRRKREMELPNQKISSSRVEGRASAGDGGGMQRNQHMITRCAIGGGGSGIAPIMRTAHLLGILTHST